MATRSRRSLYRFNEGAAERELRVMKCSRFNTGPLLVFQGLLLATVRYWQEGVICASEGFMK